MSNLRSMMGPFVGGGSSSAGVPNPFYDIASHSMPDSPLEMFDWCQFLWDQNATYKTAMDRVVSYFLTDPVLKATNPRGVLGEDDQEKWKDLLKVRLNLLGNEHLLGLDRQCYGNGYASILVPFRRHLRCQRCQSFWGLRVVAENKVFNYRWENFQAKATCPHCKFRGIFEIHDEDDARADKLKIKKWAPQEIHLVHDPFTDDVAYFWRIPEDYKTMVREGRLFMLERVSKPVLEAIRKGQKLFSFAPGELFHMKEPTVSGRKNRGMGIPRMLSSYRQMWYVAMLQKQNEAIAVDYVMPLRLLTPAQLDTGDPLRSLASLPGMNAQLRGMLKRRARNPMGWHFLPFPVEYQVAGGEAKALAPKELLDQGYDMLLNGAGVPADFYRGTMQMQVFPVSMRLFQCQWHHLTYDNNSFLRWVVERCAAILSWESVRAEHKPVQHADDAQKQMAILQLAMGGHVSLTEALEGLGLDFKEQLRKLIDEARQQNEEQQRLMEEQETSQFGDQITMGIPPVQIGAQPGAQPGAEGGGGGQPGVAATGGAAPVDPATGAPTQLGPVTQLVQGGMMPQTVDDMITTAASLSESLMVIPQAQRTSELRLLQQKNDTLHALVTKQLAQKRSQARSQGQSMVLQQQYGPNAA